MRVGKVEKSLKKVVGDLLLGPTQKTVLKGIPGKFIGILDPRLGGIPVVAKMIQVHFLPNVPGQGHQLLIGSMHASLKQLAIMEHHLSLCAEALRILRVEHGIPGDPYLSVD